MTSSNETKNASGLTPSQSQNLQERSSQPQEEKILTAIKEMYSCKPREDTFAIYTKDSVFHDPVGIAEGQSSIQSQFLALAKIFEKADIPKFRVLTNPPDIPSTTILIDQDVAYYRSASSSSPTKTLNSLLTLQTNGEGQVTRHTEEWNHQKQTTSDDGFLGMINEQRKKFTAGVTDMFVGIK
ncbi:hypothetical protein BV22DRAFT_1015753 [Leucogyrophana mollusca]|uniref:Uncharacterized protein n=1 Tax=Leucogyrophana mollusca TaxID=85980 RepID=A0ACB8BD44_9AGAM|nr:hypothetical protein BV22DRAFT_1015753 [Leucogyrophana mollusca]